MLVDHRNDLALKNDNSENLLAIVEVILKVKFFSCFQNYVACIHCTHDNPVLEVLILEQYAP